MVKEVDRHCQPPLPKWRPPLAPEMRLGASTWAIKGIAQSVIVVPLEEGDTDVSRACDWGLPEFQC